MTNDLLLFRRNCINQGTHAVLSRKQNDKNIIQEHDANNILFIDDAFWTFFQLAFGYLFLHKLGHVVETNSTLTPLNGWALNIKFLSPRNLSK